MADGIPEFNQAIVDGDATLTLDGGDIDVTDRVGRVLGKSRLMDSSETLIDPATEATLSAVEAALSNQSNLAFGQHTTATSGTAEALNGGTSQSVPDGMAVAVSPLSSNSGNVYVGDSTVGTGDGYELEPSDAGVSLNVNDVANVYVDVDTGGEGVSWIVEVA